MNQVKLFMLLAFERHVVINTSPWQHTTSATTVANPGQLKVGLHLVTANCITK